MLSGPSGSNSHFGACRMIPGVASGMMSEKAKAPAFPRDAPDATPARSNSVTS